MANTFQTFSCDFFNKIKRDYELSKETVFSVGWIGALGHPLYWFIWVYLFPQPYENAYFRFFCALLFAVLPFFKYAPTALKRWVPLYWFITITLGLPTIFTFLMLMSDFGKIYMACEVMVIFVLPLFLRGIASVIASLIIGTLLGYFAYLVFSPTDYAFSNYQEFLEFSPLLGFALLTGSIFTHGFKESVRLHEMRIAAQEKEESLKALAGSIAHEMRNPLGQIRFSLSGIRNLLPRPVAHTESESAPTALSAPNLNELYTHVAQGETSIDRGLQIISMTLDEVSGKPIDQTSFEYLPAGKATQKAVDEYSFESPGERNKVKVRVLNDFTIKANETAYVFILFNLIKNALFYFQQHPHATITIIVDAPLVRVRDTGPGIPPEVLGQLFGSFVTSGKVGGTGLGLAYCQRTMSAFGGDIVCDSVLGKFTEFKLRFPKLHPAEVELHEREVLSQAAPFFEGKRILIVDDQALLRKSTRNMLNGMGTLQDEAADGAEAIAKLRQCAYDLVIMDLNMPVLDGYAAAEQIRHGAAPGREDVAIVAYTSESAYMALVKTEKVGMNGFVSKPCTRLELIKALQAGMAAAADKARLHGASASVLIGKRVLVADDNAFNRKIAMAYLNAMGVEAMEAENGWVALQKLSKDGAIDALLLDMEMPVMDGMQAARELRSGHTAARHVPIIALTANSGELHVAQTLAAGMDAFISKPFSVDDLRAKLVKVLTRKGTQGIALPGQAGVAMTTANGVPLIHAERLDQIRRLSNGLLVECLTAYIEQMRERFVRIEEQMASENFSAFRAQLHKLVGDAGEAGFYALHQFLINDIYPAVADTHRWPVVDDWLATSKNLYAQTVEVMRQTYLAEPPA